MNQTSSEVTVPVGLRIWFVIHFIVDIIFAVPLFIAPQAVFSLLGMPFADPITPRLVASAFFAIGTTSLVMRNAGLESYKTMLTLKIIWSSAALVGLGWSLAQGAAPAARLPLLIFSVFWCAWVYYYRQLSIKA